MARRKAATKRVTKKAKATEVDVDLTDLPLDALPGSDDRLRAMSEVADMMGWKQAREVLHVVRSVPTIFPAVDWSTKVGGLPLNRFVLVHGPSSHGKTAFTTGLGYSFLKRGHFYGHIDAERTTGIDWCERLMSREFADSPAFRALRPSNYEETVDQVEKFCTAIGNARAKGKIPRETGGLLVLDSLRKLVPKNLLAKLLKEADATETGVDGMKGRAAMHKAALNAQWVDRLIPLLDDTGCTMVVIAREYQDSTADEKDKKFGNDYVIGGGKAAYFESSLVIRCVREKYIYVGGNRDEGEKGVMVGEKIRAEIHKTKLAAREDRVVKAWFHLSNGVESPEGFDRARDLLELGKRLKLVTVSGSWFSWQRRRAQGEANALKALRDPATADALEAAIRERFDLVDPEIEEAADEGITVVSANG